MKRVAVSVVFAGLFAPTLSSGGGLEECKMQADEYVQQHGLKNFLDSQMEDESNLPDQERKRRDFTRIEAQKIFNNCMASNGVIDQEVARKQGKGLYELEKSTEAIWERRESTEKGERCVNEFRGYATLPVVENMNNAVRGGASLSVYERIRIQSNGVRHGDYTDEELLSRVPSPQYRKASGKRFDWFTLIDVIPANKPEDFDTYVYKFNSAFGVKMKPDARHVGLPGEIYVSLVTKDGNVFFLDSMGNIQRIQKGKGPCTKHLDDKINNMMKEINHAEKSKGMVNREQLSEEERKHFEELMSYMEVGKESIKGTDLNQTRKNIRDYCSNNPDDWAKALPVPVYSGILPREFSKVYRIPFTGSMIMQTNPPKAPFGGEVKIVYGHGFLNQSSDICTSNGNDYAMPVPKARMYVGYGWIDKDQWRQIRENLRIYSDGIRELKAKYLQAKEDAEKDNIITENEKNILDSMKSLILAYQDAYTLNRLQVKTGFKDRLKIYSNGRSSQTCWKFGQVLCKKNYISGMGIFSSD